MQTPFTIGDGSLSWLVYPIETIVAEKLHTLADRGSANSRSKDVFDLYLLLPQANLKLLREALTATFTHRSTSLILPLSNTLERLDKAVLRRGWQSAIFGIVEPPEFDAALTLLLQALRKWKL